MLFQLFLVKLTLTDIRHNSSSIFNYYRQREKDIKNNKQWWFSTCSELFAMSITIWCFVAWFHRCRRCQHHWMKSDCGNVKTFPRSNHFNSFFFLQKYFSILHVNWDKKASNKKFQFCEIIFGECWLNKKEYFVGILQAYFLWKMSFIKWKWDRKMDWNDATYRREENDTSFVYAETVSCIQIICVCFFFFFLYKNVFIMQNNKNM